MLDDPLRSGLVRVSAVGGATDRNWGPKPINGTVYAIALSGADIFIAGEFTSIGALPRNNIAKVSATGSGAVDASWNANANARVEKLLATEDGLTTLESRFSNSTPTGPEKGIQTGTPPLTITPTLCACRRGEFLPRALSICATAWFPFPSPNSTS